MVSTANALVLPDSRIKDPKGSQMVDWEMPDGTTVRCEAEMIYCGNCGKPYGYVPKENTTFVCYLCRKCYEKYGAIAGTYAVPEDEFNKAVEHEMIERHGRPLTELEIFQLSEQGRLGSGLELLAKESPYKVYRGD